MPTYEYIAVDADAACPHCTVGFEVRQSMNAPPLTVCPQCGKPVRRAISVPNVNTGPSDRSRLSDHSLKEKGFQKLVKDDDGKYRNVLE